MTYTNHEENILVNLTVPVSDEAYDPDGLSYVDVFNAPYSTLFFKQDGSGFMIELIEDDMGEPIEASRVRCQLTQTEVDNLMRLLYPQSYLEISKKNMPVPLDICTSMVYNVS